MAYDDNFNRGPPPSLSPILSPKSFKTRVKETWKDRVILGNFASLSNVSVMLKFQVDEASGG